ncbi:anti sigma factor C-terminal domain-containing protein [Jeotgalibacillus malaysiensis]|uniref:anti-sigma factor n=1 Tax=Jeotgalibacillus malaysiensis TaxID=1508404 RepID=UPI003850EF94
MSEEFKIRLKKYYAGELSDQEAAKIELEIEQAEAYQDVMNETFPQDELPPERVGEILKRSARSAKLTVIGYVVMILLLIFPVLMLGSYIYYGFIERANTLIDVAYHTVYVTEPNASVDEFNIEYEMGLFTFDVYMDLYKEVGESTIKQGEWVVPFRFNQADFPDRNYTIDQPPKEIPQREERLLFHPDSGESNSLNEGWDTLENLPEGTVSEIYVSLDRTVPVDEVDELLDDTDAKWLWYAVDTGLDAAAQGTEGGYLPPIGYPAQTGNNWSPYNWQDQNDKQFMESLKFLSGYEEQATAIARAKWLELDERIDYLEQNGLSAYGGVITGPSKELLKLRENEDVRTIRMGEVRLWNW